MTLTAGTRLGPYEITEPIGTGGMGEVYRARHHKLRRDVAIKVILPEVAQDPGRLARFEREARTASALNHPNIVVIHDIAEQGGTTYIAMELVEGRTLREVIAGEPLPIERVVRLALQIADGLATAHRAGVLHRDVKPANVMVTSDDRVKILDFGLAKPMMTGERPGNASAATLESSVGMVVGTPLYMSPEQLSADTVDHRSDQFSFGVLLYEMVAGRPPFDGFPLVRAVLTADPPSLKRSRPDTPADLERIVRRCLAKDPADRYPSTGDLVADLRHLAEGLSGRRARPSLLGRPAVAASLGTIALALGAAGVVWARGAEERWARGEAMSDIASLVETGDLNAAFRTARRAGKYRAADPALERMMDRFTLPAEVNTVPPGAEVWVKGYATPDAPWERIGVTPLSIRIPYAMMRWRITRAGYEPFEGAPFGGGAFQALSRGLVLDSLGTRPPGMVRVPAGQFTPLPAAALPDQLPAVELPTYFLDRFEVTNRQYREFVNGGGYRDAKWWPASIERDGAQLSWRQGVDAFRDATGRPGPSTWQLGGYPAGEDEHPVSGISWFEAAAYCAFAGKSLPTIYHWSHAIGQAQLSDILVLSNIGGGSRAPVGRFRGIAGYGTYDMAGNVKEWTWNASGSRRYILGGAWNEPAYMFRHLVAHDPWARDSTQGVRCAKYHEPPAAPLLAPVTIVREYPRPAPITDEAFDLLRGIYAYDRTPVEGELVRVDTLPEYRRETVSIPTAYGDERMEVHLFIPRGVSPPYQSVIWFPGDDVYLLRSSETMSSSYLVDFIPRSGRVLVHPVYKGMYERFERRAASPAELRDMMVRWSQDIGKTIDYLETRPDIDAKRIAYYGMSSGASHAPVFIALEPRFATAVLLAGGLTRRPFRPEAHPAHFAPRVRVPTLLISGQDDFILPYELSQRPLFEMLGVPDEKKRHVRLAGGHIPSSRLDIIREVLDWLDRQLGPVGG